MGDEYSFADDYSDYYGSPSDFSNLDLSGLEGIDLSGLDFGEVGLNDLEGLDFGETGLNDLGSLLAAGADDYSDYYNVLPDADIGTFIDPAKLAEFAPYNQNLQISPENQESFDRTMQEVWDSGGYTSGWQNLGSDRVMIQEDGSAIGINTETGEQYFLSPQETAGMIQKGVLNSRNSGYYEATGGSNAAPGGGTPVTLKNGQTGTLTTDGKVINTDTGQVIGTSADVRGGVGTTASNTGGVSGGGSGNSGMTSSSGNLLSSLLGGSGNLGSLLPLLLAIMAARGGGGGGGGGSSATIPKLTATQTQTPYSAIQRAPGYRPGQGGITYFNPVQYTPKMAAGGIADLSRGRLLHGPGDGVSDSIPAQIGSDQPARLARGEYVIDARTVAALGNGSTDAGAERLDEMRKKILRDDRKAGVGKDSKAYRHLKA